SGLPRGGGAAVAPRRHPRAGAPRRRARQARRAARGARGGSDRVRAVARGPRPGGVRPRGARGGRRRARDAAPGTARPGAPRGGEGLVTRLRGRFSDELLLEARLVGRKEGGRSTFDWFRNRLMVPLIAPGGAVLGFGARAFGDEPPKYLNSSESTVYHKGQF